MELWVKFPYDLTAFSILVRNIAKISNKCLAIYENI